MESTSLERDTASSGLNDGEISALACVASGMTLDTAARHLDLSARTVRRRIRAACGRLCVDTPIEAVVWATKHGLI